MWAIIDALPLEAVRAPVLQPASFSAIERCAAELLRFY